MASSVLYTHDLSAHKPELTGRSLRPSSKWQTESVRCRAQSSVLDKVYLAKLREHPLNIFNADISSVSAQPWGVILFSEESVSRQRDGWVQDFFSLSESMGSWTCESNYAGVWKKSFLAGDGVHLWNFCCRLRLSDWIIWNAVFKVNFHVWERM